MSDVQRDIRCPRDSTGLRRAYRLDERRPARRCQIAAVRTCRRKMDSFLLNIFRSLALDQRGDLAQTIEEERARVHTISSFFFDGLSNAQGQERVATQLEKIVLGIDRVDSQDRAPDLGHLLLEAWCR